MWASVLVCVHAAEFALEEDFVLPLPGRLGSNSILSQVCLVQGKHPTALIALWPLDSLICWVTFKDGLRLVKSHPFVLYQI